MFTVELQSVPTTDDTMHIDGICWSRVCYGGDWMDHAAGTASRCPDWFCYLWADVGWWQKAAVPK